MLHRCSTRNTDGIFVIV